MKKIKWGIIGAGEISINRTIPGMLQSEQSELVAINRTNKEKLKEVQNTFNVKKTYTNVDDLVQDSEVDAVYIASPIKYHLEHALAAANAKKPIFLEKPIGMNVEEVELIRDECVKNGVFFEAALMMRYHTLHQKIRQMIKEGDIGELVSIRMDFCFWYPTQREAWRLDKAVSGGGVFMDLGPHMVDLVQYITGREISKVHALTDTLTFSYEVEDSASVLLGLKHGGHALLSAHFNIPDDISAKRIEIYGTEGVLIAEETLGQEEKGKLLYKRTGDLDYQVFTHPEGDLYTKEIDYFINVMNQEKKHWNDLMEYQVNLQKVIDQVYKN